MENDKLEFETIKRNYKPKIIIGVGVLLILTSVVMFVGTRAKYRSVQSIKLASGTVKYNASDLHLVAIKVSEDGKTYSSTSTLPEGKYTLNEEKSKCRIPTLTLTGEDAPVASGVTIEYKNGRINVLGLLEKNTKCYVYFDKVLSQTIETILATIKNSTSYKTGTPDFTQIATGTEKAENNGIYETDDSMYKTTDNPNPKSYYWRGAATTNHVIFDNMCWRIVRINGDGSIRLIYNGLVQSDNSCKDNGQNADSVVLKSTAYNKTFKNNSYVGWTYTVGKQRPSTANPQTSGTASTIKSELENWYGSNISEGAKNKVIIGKFCNDRNTQSSITWEATPSSHQYYAAHQRLSSGTKKPTLSCPAGDVYSLDVGMITADEVQFAGASWNATNQSYYLYNGQYYWTMSPYMWYYSLASGSANMIIVNDKGYLRDYNVGDDRVIHVRPVINLRSDVTFNAEADGTQNNPYIVQ